MKVKSLSHVQLFGTPWTVAHQAPPSMEISRQEYWSGLPFPSPGELPDPGIELTSPTFQVDSLPLSYLGGPILGDTVTKSFAAAEQESPDFFACSVCVLYSFKFDLIVKKNIYI